MSTLIQSNKNNIVFCYQLAKNIEDYNSSTEEETANHLFCDTVDVKDLN